MPMKPGSIIHALPYPALEAGNLSFPDGNYEAGVKIGSDGYSVQINHDISGAPFIEKLIEEGQAKFYCLLAIPKAGVRKIVETGQNGSVEWKADLVGEPPKVQPFLLYVGDDKQHTFTKSCGVAEIWQGKKITLPKGARLARGGFYNVLSSDHAFLSFKEDKNGAPGTFSVKENTEDGFYFTVHAASDIHQFIQNPGKNMELRQAILTGVVSRCFSILKERHKDLGADENNFPNLKVLSDKLQLELGHDWTADDEFDPVHAATRMYPVKVPVLQCTNDGEDE